jgi:hypothetical protein
VTNLVSDKVRDLADSLADLKVGLRLALAVELAQLVAQAVGDVVRTLVAGRTGVGEFRLHRVSPTGHEADPRDAEDEAFEDMRRYEIDEPKSTAEARSPAHAAAPVAVAAAAHVVRWWLGRRGNLITAIGAGLGVSLLGIAGGTVVRTALAILTAAVDLLSVTDGLDWLYKSAPNTPEFCAWPAMHDG